MPIAKSFVTPRSNLERASLTELDAHLFPDFDTIDPSQGDSQVQLQHCNKPLLLDVPRPANNSRDASRLIFGISTTIKRLEASIPQLLRRLPHTQARLIVIVIGSEQVIEESSNVAKLGSVKADPQQKEGLQSRMRGLGMDVSLVEPLALQDTISERYFSLIRIMHNSRDNNTQWITLIHDDTFLPSVSALLSMLDKYDPRQEHYIGALSEDWWAVARYGMMGFGGAGIFLSISIAKTLANNHQLCNETSRTIAGDVRVMDCIYHLTGTKLTHERDLRQVDVQTDLSGVFESGHMPLSLHHWKPGAVSVYGYNLPMMHLVADICGNCFLQRWQFGKEMVLTNGYSIALYPKGSLKNGDMDKMEETWDELLHVQGSINRGIDHSLGPKKDRN